MSIVDIIVPVYRGLAETRACLDSVLASNNATAAEIVVIDDASPEPALSAYLDQLASAGRITLLRNEVNRGFVVSVNRGIALHGERDVVLLNSDTEVADGWLDRLAACALRQENTASVSPFSNHATLCSYPRIGQANALPADIDLGALDRLFARVNAGKSVELPTTVGFCMLLRRAALDEVGSFDAAAFGRGYGEENDWCLRAAGRGYRHYLCADAFVFHRGEVSFGASAVADRARAQAIIDARYPQYGDLIAAHFAEDPARPLRRAVDIARLSRSSRPRILFVTHNWGGGTERHVRDLAAIIGDRAEVLVLRPETPAVLRLEWLRGEAADNVEEFSAHFEFPMDQQRLLDFLRAVGVARVHVHHIHQHPHEILLLAARLGVPLDVTLHDYFPLSPQYHLSPGGAVPEQELANPWGLTLAQWRHEMARFLAGAERVICPSQDLAGRMEPYFPGIRFQVWPHPQLPATPLPRQIKVLVLGGLTVEKGLDVVRACGADAATRNLPIHFRILGHTEHPLGEEAGLPISVYGSYREQDLARLIALERADAFLFPAQIPESFSFTLTAAMQTGLPLVASRLGSFPERLQGYQQAILVEWNAAPGEWNNAIVAAAPGATVVAPGTSHATGAEPAAADYARRYLQPLSPVTAAAASAAASAVLPARYFYFGKHLSREAERPLTQLYAAGIECGHGGSRIELKRRLAVFDQQLAHARESAQAAHDALHRNEDAWSEQVDGLKQAIDDLNAVHTEEVARLVAERDAARAAYASIESSTSWRMTAPMRNALQAVRDWRHRLGDLRRGLRRLPRDAAIATQILKSEGVVALGKRVHGKLSRRSDFAGHAGVSYAQETAIAPLALPYSENPRWSLIVPVYGQHLLTFTCLKSIAGTCADLPIEVILVDDCSPVPAADALSPVAGLRIIRNETNLGFLRNCNKAAAVARGEYVVILNNDLILTGDWLERMAAVFASFPDAGLVGAKLIYPDGKLQEAGGIVWRDGSAWNLGRGEDPDRPEYSYLREADYCSGACLMLKREFWNELGGFDEAYAPAYYEDTDLAFRVREKGRRVYYQPHSVVVHFEGQSSGTDVTQGVKRHQVVNQKTFAARWHKVLAKHCVNGLSPQLERDRGALRRVLVVDACMLTPDQDSGSLRMFEMLGIIRRLGCKVTFVADNLEYRLPYARDIQALGVEVLHHPYVTSITGVIERAGADYDVVILSRAPVAAQYVDLVRAKMPQAKLVFDTVDLHFLRQGRRAELHADEAQLRAAAAMQEQELGIIAKSDVTLVVSPVEQKILDELAPRARIHIVSNIHVADPGPAPFADREGILFIGGFRHPPNLDAITWYVENVLPILRARQPGLVTTVIGSNAPPALQKFAAADFVIAGFVPDVAPHYRRARLSISPLRYGAGVKGKVNLAMQYGVPVVATSPSVEGMFLSDGVDVLVADGAEAFADAVIRLHGDEDLWWKLREGGLRNIETWFSRGAARKALASVLDL